ncbi:MAG TPA: alcohol dehydrogenase catalytic domain-containing protein [Solirubrobacteraceae bacterium]|nr:alcohol dehydrogenase catalytic domain-containing protein [Solirubrobacteraceae bacterium]
MRAFVLTGPREFAVKDVPRPEPASGEVVVSVERAGVCGTDVELFTGEMPYLHQGHSRYPLRPGHEWAGTVTDVGEGVEPAWLGRRVMGDTMLGCGECRRCRRGVQHTCSTRQEVGIRGGRDGALAEALAVPARSLHALPDDMDWALGALVEPGGGALRAARAAGCGAGDIALVLGPGTVGLLVAMFLRSFGVEVHLLGSVPSSLEFARSLGFDDCWGSDEPPRSLAFDAVVDCSGAPSLPALAVDLVQPGGRVVCIGLAVTPSEIDTRSLVLGDITAVGVLSASPGLEETIALYAAGAVDPRPIVAGVVGLGDVGALLDGTRPAGCAPGPKFHVDPRR